MKNTGLFKILNSGNIKRVLAVIMAIMLLTLTACSNGEPQDGSSQTQGSSSQQGSSDVSSNDASSNDASSNDGVSSDDATSSEDSTSSGNTTTNNSGNGGFVLGDLTIDDQETKNTIATDANERELIVDPTNLMTNYKGYAEKERKELLDEILNTPNTAELYDIKGKIYYVSTSGNDANDGTSPEKAIQTLAAVDGLLLEDGDAVLFERDCIWRMYEKFNCRSNVIYGSYGEGRKPMFLGSPKNFAQETWKPSKKKNVWQINYMYAYPCGAFFDQGKEAGYLKTSFRAMTANTHFYFDESMATLYLYCDKGNPSDVYESIEFTQNVTDIWLPTGVSNVIVDNLAIRYATCGIGMNFMNTGITVTNCEIGFTGGGGSDPTRLRAGNGIGTWCGGAEMYVRHNWIYQTFDSALSPQGNVGKYYFYENMEYTDNLLEFNNADIEWWDHGNDSYTDEITWSKFVNFKMEDNIMRFTSLGWGTREDDGGIRGIEGVWFGTTEGNYLENITFKNNIIDCPGRQIFNFRVQTQKQRDAMHFANNTYYVRNKFRKDDVRMIYGWTLYWEGSIKSYFGTDAKSTKEAIHLVDPTAKVYWYK